MTCPMRKLASERRDRSPVYLAIYLLQDAFGGAWKVNTVSGNIAIIEVLLGTLIASGKIAPFAAGPVLLGSLIYRSRAFSFHFSRILPDRLETTIVFIAAAILMGSPLIVKFVKRLSAHHQVEILSKNERSKAEMDLFDENVEITIRIDDRGFDILRMPRCVVTMHLPKEDGRGIGQRIGNA